MGCVLYKKNAASIYLRVAPHRLTLEAFAELSDVVNNSDCNRFALSWYGSTWQDEILPNSKALRTRLASLMMQTKRSSRFHQRHADETSLTREHYLKPILALYRANGGALNMKTHGDDIARLTSGKYLSTYFDKDHGHLKFSAFGRNWTIYKDARWLTRCIGQRVEDQPDYLYGRWVADTYREAMLRYEPVLHDVDVIVRDPTEAGKERRIQYNRLLIPVKGPGGNHQLLSTSCLDLGVDLRAPVH
jgi:hypothetical protein